MTKVIVYKNDEGGISIVHPAPNAKLTIEQVAAKSIPAGKSYAIMEKSDVPSDRTFRNAWDIDDELLTEITNPVEAEV